MSRIRIWSPFVIASVGATVTLILESRICEYLGVYNPLLGCLEVGLRAGVLIGLAAALASRTWRGLLTFVLGLLAVGAMLVIVGVLIGEDIDLNVAVVSTPLYVALTFGMLGVPTYAIVIGIASVLRCLYGRLAA